METERAYIGSPTYHQRERGKKREIKKR